MSWNKGLTKDTDERVKNNAKAQGLARLRHIQSHEHQTFQCRCWVSEEQLIAGNARPRRFKKQLLGRKLLEDKCSKCGLSPKWNNEPLTLELDHINGNHNDWRLTNLRILCPNCHTQTDTYKGRNVTWTEERRQRASITAKKSRATMLMRTS